MDGIDSISALPDCLLQDIMSFLRTKESICTSMVSKRWIDVWKFVPCLYFVESDFISERKFKNFVNAVLLFLKSYHVDTFRLTWDSYSVSRRGIIKKWISHVISLKPRILSLNLYRLDRALSCVFSCTSLELLVMCQRDVNRASLDPHVINLPRLKRLELGKLRLTDDFVQGLTSGCPILEEFIIERCELDLTKKIYSSTLKKLIIYTCTMTNKARLWFSIPSLVSFSCNVSSLGHIICENMLSVEYATIELLGLECLDDRDGTGEVQFLRRLPNIKYLKLDGCDINIMFKMELPDLPYFRNLESLNLGLSRTDECFEQTASLLWRIPNLEKLTLKFFEVRTENIFQLRKLSEIQCGSLKTLEIDCLEYDLRAQALVKYLRNTFRTIENVKINGIDLFTDADHACVDNPKRK